MISTLGIGVAQNLMRGLQGPGGVAPAVPAAPFAGSGGGDFGSMMSAMFKDVAGNLQAGEAASLAGIQGKMPLQQVVEAVMQAEQLLHTAVVVRDKVVGAYLEITRMQI